jgi:hypothetical protein
MRRPADPDEHVPSVTPKTSRARKKEGISDTSASQTLSANHASMRSPSPFEASTTHRSRNNSVDAGSTRQGDLYDATPAREIGPPHLTVSLAGTSDEDNTSSDSEDDITNGMNNISLGVSENDGHGASGEEDISAALGNLDFNRQTDSGLSPYSMRDEPLPAEPYYEQGFQTALKQGTQLARNVITCLEGCPAVHDLDSSLYKLSRDALTLSEYQSATTRTIGIIGKSGSGKFLPNNLHGGEDSKVVHIT